MGWLSSVTWPTQKITNQTRNASKKSFAPVFEQPMSMGTRCHQLAMYVVYESPLQMLADSPSNYLREPEMMEFLGPVPTTWDETRVLDGKIGRASCRERVCELV